MIASAPVTEGPVVSPEAGVTGPATSDCGPLPAALFTARMRNRYAVPFIRLVTAWLVVAALLPEMSVQLPQSALPAFCWYWYLVMLESLGFVQARFDLRVPRLRHEARRLRGLGGGGCGQRH